MKKRKLLLGLLLSAVVAVFATGCGGKDFALSHFDGMDLENGYDTDLLYRNNSVFWGGDSGVIWVSKEQDPENGGYFYQYMSETAGVSNMVPSTADGKTWPSERNNGLEQAYMGHVFCTRSRDLNDWEPCGAVDNGMALYVDKNEWVESQIWAPEVVYDAKSGKYFMYFSGISHRNDENYRALGATYSDEDDSANRWLRCYLGIAVADAPQGPFRLVTSENVYGDATATNPDGKVITAINPPFMLDKEFDELFYTDEFKARADFAALDDIYAVIDLNPFFDENGDFYLYFANTGTNSRHGNTISGIKMKDMITPDYSTITMLVAGGFHRSDIAGAEGTAGKNFVRVEYKGSTYNDPAYPRHLLSSYTSTTKYADGTEQSEEEKSDGAIAEAPQMLTTKDKDGKTVYLLTYSPRGVSYADYDVKFAYSYSPLGPFVKPRAEQGSTILGVDEDTNDFMSNLGHVQFLRVDGEDWIFHWEGANPFGSASGGSGRIYALSSMSWQYEESLGFDVPVANGPSTALTPLPSVYTGYRNVAPRASIKATNEIDGSAKYLNDGMTVTAKRNEGKEFRAKKNKTKITLTFPEATTIRGILLYNSYTYANTFKNISHITFKLAENPVWHVGTHDTCSIANLPYNEAAYKTANGIQPGSAAVATFNEIKVTEIEIEFTGSDKLGSGDELRISEIVVLGK